MPHHRLRDLVKYLNIEVENLHRALGDCEAAFGCYENFKKAAIENSSIFRRLHYIFDEDKDACGSYKEAAGEKAGDERAPRIYHFAVFFRKPGKK